VHRFARFADAGVTSPFQLAAAFRASPLLVKFGKFTITLLDHNHAALAKMV